MSTQPSPDIDLSLLDLNFNRKGVRASALWAEPMGQLTSVDVLALQEAGESSEKKTAERSQTLRRLRSNHHQIARLIAVGMKDAEISLVTGMCVSRISVLKSDPTFAELVQFYSDREDDMFVDVRARLESLGMTASEVLLERVMEDPDGMANSDLLDILKAALDRAGHSPVKRSETKKIVFSAADMERLKNEARGQIYTGTVVKRDVEKIEKLRSEEQIDATPQMSHSEGSEVGGDDRSESVRSHGEVPKTLKLRFKGEEL